MNVAGPFAAQYIARPLHKERHVRPLQLAICLLSLSAFAYVMPSVSILRRMVNEDDKAQIYSWKIEGSLSFFGATAKEAAPALKTTLEGTELQADGVVSLRFPHRCRFDALSADGTTSSAIVSNGKVRTEGTGISAMQTAIEHLCGVLAVRTGDEEAARAAVERHLAKLGIEVKKATFGRMAGNVTYVIGDPAEGKSNFHVHKDSFAPARLRFTDAQQQKWDVRFHDFFSPMTGNAFPRVTEVWKNGELQLRYTVLKAEPKAQFADKVF